jgi:hypothetical protein
MAGPVRVFVPSIYGDNYYGTILYGGQWVILVPPPCPPPPTTVSPPPPPPPYPPPVLWPSASAPAPSVAIPAGYSIGPIAARAVTYESIMISWTQPALTANIVDFRLLRSRYGYPVDQNDGAILLDSGTGGYPQDMFFDNAVVPGTMHYYGIYILIQLAASQVWYRAGFAAVLAVADYDSTFWLQDRLPDYFSLVSDSNELTTSDAFGNAYLDQFMSVLGWGEDYLQTQLAITANMNNPQVIPVNYLAGLAGTLGFPYYSEITSGVTRNALSNNAALIQQRGTLEGIEAMITQLTGWGADVRVGYNKMLEDDQADFTDPVYAAWNTLISYDTGEYVTYEGYTYVSIGNNNLGTPPTGAQSSNAYWTSVYYTPDTGLVPTQISQIPLALTTVAAVNPNGIGVYQTVSGGTVTVIKVGGVTTGLTSGQFFIPAGGTIALTYTGAPTTYTTTAPVLLNSTTGWLNTWEPLIDGMSNSHPTNSTAMVEMKGILDPILLDYVANGLAVYNNSGSTSNIELRSLSRVPSDSAATDSNWPYPNTGQVVGDGLPVKYTTISELWNPLTQYTTNKVVNYQGLPFMALKSSQGITPPSNGVASNEWQPVGYDQRIAVMLSCYTSQAFTAGGDQQYDVVPYALWFDETGTFISSLYARTNLGGGAPQSIAFDSFSLPSNWGTTLASTSPDILGNNVGAWTARASTFTASAFVGGSIVPSSQTAQTIATMTYSGAAAYVGVTLSNFNASGGGNYCGVVLRWASNTSYVRVDQQAIVSVNGATITTLATHSTPANPGDRLTVSVTGTTYTAYINGTQVSTATSALNSAATIFGVIVDQTVTVPTVFGKPMNASIYAELRAARQRPARNRRMTVHAQINSSYAALPVLGREVGIVL